jgi:hypothetical protein
MFEKIQLSKNRPSQEVFRLVSKIKDEEKRNLLRGMVAKQYVSSKDIDSIRRNSSANDSAVIGALLKGPNRISGELKNSKKKKSAELFSFVEILPVGLRNEVAYTAGYINSMIREALELIPTFRSLAHLEHVSSSVALERILDLARRNGASNYLSYKLAYIRSARELDDVALNLIAQIESEIQHRENPGLHFSALENLSSKISLFLIARRRVSGFEGGFEGGFRKSISLSNFVPTPLSYEDIPGFLLRATESSLVDTIYSVLIISNLAEKFPIVWQEFVRRLDPELIEKLSELRGYCAGLVDGELVTGEYHQMNIDSVYSLDLYRISAAFLERPRLTIFRNMFDQVIGARLLASIIGEGAFDLSETVDNRVLLLGSGICRICDGIEAEIDSFYRTYLYLQFIKDRMNIISLGSGELRFIYENTLALESLLSEAEMRAIYQTAPEETRSLATVLALALYRQKAVDPDVDFEFRSDFVEHVVRNHEGSILQFIESLLTDSPSIANYIVGSLDEVTLEKMYTLVTNTSQALAIRGDILRAVGRKLNRIDYFVEADAITTRTKVATLQQYFDSSRMYVDSVAMKRWLDSNPSVSTEQYRSLYSRAQTQVANVNAKRLGESNIILVEVEGDEYLVTQIVKDAFGQFCSNSEFGIESYLGRRIRHNTLEGVMNEAVDAVINNLDYRGIVSMPWGREAVSTWQREYRAIIDKLRRDRLQFKTTGALFSADLDVEDPVVRDNIRQLANTLRTAGGAELLNELVISFCWKQIAPQLDKASRFIKTDLLNVTNVLVDRVFERPLGALEQRMKSELHQAVNGVFKKVASWFQVPQTGFISASVRELSNIILLDMNKPLNLVMFVGNAVEKKYTGMSVHRIYDCLAVLLMNAEKHAENGAEIHVSASSSSRSPDMVIERVEICVGSVVAQDKYDKSLDRIKHAIDQEEAGIDMVTEGFTGIKKLKFITRMNEGFHTISVLSDDSTRKVQVGFSLHAELPKLTTEVVDQVEVLP